VGHLEKEGSERNCSTVSSSLWSWLTQPLFAFLVTSLREAFFRIAFNAVFRRFERFTWLKLYEWQEGVFVALRAFMWLYGGVFY
jgi:hypothetical protein